MKFYKCNECNQIIISLTGNKDLNMTELTPNTVDASVEKHTPVVKVDGNKVVVTVGSTTHPMLEEHYIEWILIETNQGFIKKDLKPGTAPTATFILGEAEELVNCYSYCNLHGLWKA